MRRETGISNVLVTIFLLSFMFLAHAIELTDYISTTESPLSIVQANYTSGSDVYTIVTIASKESLVLKNGDLVKDLDTIKTAINAKCFGSTYPSSATLTSIKNNVLAFNASRNAETSFGGFEEFCDSITGQTNGDEGGCKDTISCQVACNMGSYSCMQYGQGSALFIPTLLEYANVKRSIDSEVNTVLNNADLLNSASSFSQVTFNVSSKIREMYNAIKGLQDDEAIYEANKLFTTPTFAFCTPVGYVFNLNGTALSSALAATTQMLNNAACFDNVDSSANFIFNETFRRIDLYGSTKAKLNLQNQFNNLSSRYNELSDTGTSILELMDDSQISNYLSSVESLNQAFYANLSSGQTDSAGLVLSYIVDELDDFENYLNITYSSFNTMVDYRDNAEMLFEKASVVIDESDSTLYADLQTLKSKYSSLNAKLSEKIVYSEIPSFSDEFSGIVKDLEALIAKKKESNAETVPSALSSTMKGVSLAVLDTFSTPLGIKESEKRAWMTNIPLIIIGITDILLLAVFSVAFFFLVMKGSSAFLRTKVINTWIAIFAVVIVLLLGLSYALNVAISNEISSTSIYDFMSEVKDAGKVNIMVEYLSTENSTAILGCASDLEVKFIMDGVEVNKISVVDGICNDRLLTECMSDLGDEPLIQLQYSDIDDSNFYTFYKPEGIIQGGQEYFEKCYVAEFME